jgi:tetratricopeptide (TPR) repeat protein
MPRRFLLFPLLLVGVLLALAGCEGGERIGLTAETDDPGYRRGKELLRQGRNQEALSAFQKVIERRDDDAAESHLEAGLLYQQHIRDPIAAIYHYRKFRELKPNSPQADLVRQRIDAAKREFASTLPGDPLNNTVDPRFNSYDQVERLRRENEALKADLADFRARGLARSSGAAATGPERETTSTATLDAGPAPVAPVEDGSPLVALDVSLTDRSAGTLSERPAVPEQEAPLIRAQAPPVATPAPAAAATPRTHVVVRGDTLQSIALRYYSDRSRFRDIYAANRGLMNSPNDLRIGMELKLP